MKKNKILNILILTASCITLGACSFTTSKEDSNVYTVQYFDDSETPVMVGYAYVIKGRQANMRELDGVSYDKRSHSSAIPSKVGSHFVFDGYEGQYEDGTPVDLNNVQGNCDVYAKFVEEDYKLSYVFKNGVDTIRDNNGNVIKPQIKYGDVFDFSATTASMEYQNPKYGYDYDYKGVALSGDKKEVVVNSSDLNWKTAKSAPVDIDAKGTLVVVFNDEHEPEYPTYYCNGVEWIEAGKLSENLSLKFNSVHEEKKKLFNVSIYQGTTLKGTVGVAYTEALIETSTSTGFTFTGTDGTSVIVDGTSYSTKYLKYTKEVADRIQEGYSEKTVELAHSMGDCSIIVS